MSILRSARARSRAALKAVTPPVLLSAYRRFRIWRTGEGAAQWVALRGGWPERAMPDHGWQSRIVLDGHLAPWREVAAGTAYGGPFGTSRVPYGPDETDYGLHNRVMSFGHVLALASADLSDPKVLTLLDWEGGVGGNYVYARALLPDVEIRYDCRESTLLAEGGKLLLPRASFHTHDRAALARRYRLVLANDSIAASPDWRAVLTKLARPSQGFLYVDRVPIVEKAASYVAELRPYGQESGPPSWVLNRTEFLDAAARLGLALTREFLVSDHPPVRDSAEKPAYRGFLFRAAPARPRRSRS